MNDSPDSPERADSTELMLTQREARSVSGADADPGGTRRAQQETSPASQNSVKPTSLRPAQRETSPASQNPMSPVSREPHEPQGHMPIQCR